MPTASTSSERVRSTTPGPGQLPIFIVSSLAQQAAQASVSGESPIRIVTGNPETRRDFTDVRDVVRAYRLLAERGRAGQVYNVCSGRSISAADQIAVLAELLAPPRSSTSSTRRASAPTR